jgi:hypothetical protein
MDLTLPMTTANQEETSTEAFWTCSKVDSFSTATLEK